MENFNAFYFALIARRSDSNRPPHCVIQSLTCQTVAFGEQFWGKSCEQISCSSWRHEQISVKAFAPSRSCRFPSRWTSSERRAIFELTAVLELITVLTCAPASSMFPIEIASSATNPETFIPLNVLQPITICSCCRVPVQSQLRRFNQ